MQTVQRRMAFSGAALFSIGLYTGLWTAAAFTGAVQLQMPRLALATHLNGLLGGLWILAVAFTFSFLSYDPPRLRRLFYLVAVPCWANWFITLLASIAGENGLNYKGTFPNDAIAVGLQAFVVLPALVGTIYWLRGFSWKGAA